LRIDLTERTSLKRRRIRKARSSENWTEIVMSSLSERREIVSSTISSTETKTCRVMAREGGRGRLGEGWHEEGGDGWERGWRRLGDGWHEEGGDGARDARCARECGRRRRGGGHIRAGGECVLPCGRRGGAWRVVVDVVRTMTMSNLFINEWKKMRPRATNLTTDSERKMSVSRMLEMYSTMK
jgi:hypothetical protein